MDDNAELMRELQLLGMENEYSFAQIAQFPLASPVVTGVDHSDLDQDVDDDDDDNDDDDDDEALERDKKELENEFIFDNARDAKRKRKVVVYFWWGGVMETRSDCLT
jgi:hypothetical protein